MYTNNPIVLSFYIIIAIAILWFTVYGAVILIRNRKK